MLAYKVTKQFSHGFISYCKGDLLTPESVAVKVYDLTHNIKPVFVLDADELREVSAEVESINPDEISKADLPKVRKLLKDLKKVFERQGRKYGE